jgi:hypothetical protein
MLLGISSSFFQFFPAFSLFFSISLEKPPKKHFVLQCKKFPPPHTPFPPPPKKKKTIVCGYDVFLQIKTLIRGFLLEYSLQACNCIPSGISM